MKRRTRIGVGVVFFMVSTLLSRGRRNCQPFVAARYALKVTALSPYAEPITSRRDHPYEAPKGFSSEYFAAQQRLIFHMLHLTMKMKISTIALAAMLFVGLSLTSSFAQVGISIGI